MYYIYIIVNKINNKTYIGQHKSDNWQDSYMGSGYALKAAKKKYGKKNFEKFLIQYCNTLEEANKAEIYWIAEYRKRGKAEYNISAGGAGLRAPMSEETKRKISEARKGSKGWNKGIPMSESAKRKLSESERGKKGTPHTEEFKKYISSLFKGRISPTKNMKWKLVDGKRIYYREEK